MKLKKMFAVVLMSLLLLPALSLHTAYASVARSGGGLGISPSRLSIDHMLRGVEHRQTFVLSHGNHEEAKYLRVLVDDEIADWVTTDQGLEFTWPEDGEQQFPINVIVTPPRDAPNGTYSGDIRIINTIEPDVTAEGNSAIVSLAVSIKAEFTLSDEQVLDYDVHTIRISPEVEEETPLEFTLHIENKGNVRAAPTRIEVDFYDKYNESKIASEDAEGFGSVAAFDQDGEILVELPHGLSTGQYWARVLVFQDDTLLKEADAVFEVLPTGTLEKEGKLKGLENEANIDVGSVLKINSEFENTGEQDLVATLMVEIYRDDQLVEVLESTARSVRVGQTEQLAVFFTPQEAGTYMIEGKAEYAGQETDIARSKVTVGMAAMEIFTTRNIAIGVAILIALIIILKLIGRSAKKDVDELN